VPAAFNFGSDTAETIGNVEADAGIQMNNGLLYSEMTEGPGALGSLWNQSETSIVTIHSPIRSGTLEVSSRSSYSNAMHLDFTGGQATLTLFPETYVFSVFNSKGRLVGSATLLLYPGRTYSASA
jgi:hypothetical protein